MSITLRGRVVSRQDKLPNGQPALCTVRFFVNDFATTDLVLENRKGWELDDQVEALISNAKDANKLEIV